MDAPVKPRGGRAGWPVHRFAKPGYVTLCGKNADRCRGTWTGDITCATCAKIEKETTT